VRGEGSDVGRFDSDESPGLGVAVGLCSRSKISDSMYMI